MRAPQSFWRYHNKPRPLRQKHSAASTPKPGTVAHVRLLMSRLAERAIAAGQPRPLFPFEAGEVAAIYTWKKDLGKGTWFALVDGRVFRDTGELDTADHAVYIET